MSVATATYDCFAKVNSNVSVFVVFDLNKIWTQSPSQHEEAKAGALPVPPADVAICANVLISPQPAVNERILAAVWGRVRAGGRLVVLVPSAESARLVVKAYPSSLFLDLSFSGETGSSLIFRRAP